MKIITMIRLLSFAIFLLLITALSTQAQIPWSVQSSESFENVQSSAPTTLINNQRVLLIGDSQTAGHFSTGILTHATALGAIYFSSAGQVGWGVRRWWRARFNVGRLVRLHRPTLVLIQLGGNDWTRSGRSTYPETVRNFWGFVKEQAETYKPSGTTVDYCWISPPTIVGRRASEIQPGRDRAARVIRNSIGEEYYVESGDITGGFGRTPDGLHFTYEGAMELSRRIMPRIEQCIAAQRQTR